MIDHRLGDGFVERTLERLSTNGLYNRIVRGEYDLNRLRLLCDRHNRESALAPPILYGDIYGIKLGRNVDIRAFVILYGPLQIGSNVFVGEFSHLRENTSLADGVVVGSHCQLEGNLSIGERTRLHSCVHIGKHTIIGRDCFIAPQVIITNTKWPLATNPKFSEPEGVVIEDRVKVGAGASFLPGIKIGHDALIGAGANVTRDVFPYAIVIGNPARVVGDIRDLEAYQ